MERFAHPAVPALADDFLFQFLPDFLSFAAYLNAFLTGPARQSAYSEEIALLVCLCISTYTTVAKDAPTLNSDRQNDYPQSRLRSSK